jgi:hypothetical protein
MNAKIRCLSLVFFWSSFGSYAVELSREKVFENQQNLYRAFKDIWEYSLTG